LTKLSGQTIQKGNLVGVHIVDLKLYPDVTYNQWKEAMHNWINKYEELLQGDAKVFLVEGIRGESKNEIGLIYLFKSASARDKYARDDGTPTELGTQIQDKLKPELQAFEKIEKSFSTKYTDWIVQ
jgi:hypothetical protein